MALRKQEVAGLRQRLAQLESGGTQQAPAPPDGAPDRLLFGQDATGQLSAQEWEQLHAAGGCPKKIGVGVGGSSEPKSESYAKDVDVTSDLVKALVPKSQSDPLSAVLGGSDNAIGGSSSGSSGVKGYAAREFFLRQIEEEKTVVEHARRNARVELRVAESREEPALMRQYLEQRIPVGDHKFLLHGAGSRRRRGTKGLAGLLCPASIPCRAELSGQRSYSPVMASHRGFRTQLPDDVRAQEEAVSKPLRPAAAGDVGCSKCFLFEGCGHIREPSTQSGGKRKTCSSRDGEGGQGAEKNQEVEGGTGGDANAAENSHA